MKGVLEFDLPEEEPEFREAVDGGEVHRVVREVVNFIRQRRKYGIPDTIKTVEEAYNEVWDEVFAALDAHNINLDR